ncbi:MAG TPA: nucleoside deaminase [Gemmatimonadales bacterium]|jgi:tRNA(Arg) A34 adenosine deaminase TadA|nr:nucleoside deaminase [Gemmatimonadales bacterium]
MTSHPAYPVVRVTYPEWVDSVVDWDRSYGSDDDRMRLAIAVARANVERATGGPFGAAVFEAPSGRLVSVGTNSVVRLNNCTLHAEMVAFMMAQQRVGSFTLNAPGLAAHDLVTSCEPCAMCLGATLWSGVQRVVYGAAREDASRLEFEEGPVFPESYRYLEERGLRIVRDVLREEARAVLELYRATGGKIYNG